MGSNGRRFGIGIAGSWGGMNLGDEAILEGILGRVDLYFFYDMVGIDMARLADILGFTHTGSAGAAARVLVTPRLLTPGTLAFLPPAR